MDDSLPLPAADGDVAALIDDWLSTPTASPPADAEPAAAESVAPPDGIAGATLADAATLLEALEADALTALAPIDPVAHAQPAATRKDRYVVFTSAGAAYAVLETSVTEVERVPKITAVPRVPDWVRGVTSLRGEVISVIDLRLFLGLEPTSLHTGRLLVVRLAPQEHEELSLGLLVDTVDQIASVAHDAVRPPASPLEGPLAPYLTGVARVGDRLAAALDLDALLQSADIRQFDDRQPE